jgi:hypothetical protein
MSNSDLITDIHQETTRLDSHELVRQLKSHLGPTLVAALANVRDPKLPNRWEKSDGPTPRSASLSRLQMAHRVWALISNSDSDSVARAWFIGANPRLGEVSPIIALREGLLAEVHDAAVAFSQSLDG